MKDTGFATRMEAAHAAGPSWVVRRNARLRPSVRRPTPADIGICLGRTARRLECWASLRDSVCVLGPPGSGKGLHLCIPLIVDYPGPVVTTSTRPDNLAATYHARAARGPVAVFDPEGLAPGIPPGPRWSLCRGCDDPKTAMQRAATLVGSTAGSEERDGYWKAQTVLVVQALLHAAAVADGTALDLYRWSCNHTRAAEALHMLRHESKVPAWADGLEATLTASDARRDSVWSAVANTFAPLGDPGVMDAVTPDPGDIVGELDPEGFLAWGGTVYLLGTRGGADRFVAAFLEDVVTVARRLAARSPGARIDPPLGLVLDEAANYPLAGLPGWASELGGSGVTVVCVLQSLSQARDRWGAHAAGALWEACSVKVVLGGGSNAHDLEDAARLIGDREEAHVSTHHPGLWQAGSRNVSTRTVPILTPARLRTLPFGQAVLLLRSARPILLTLTAWPARKDCRTLNEGKAQVETLLQGAAGNAGC